MTDGKLNKSAAKEKIQQLSNLPSLAVVKYQLIRALNKDSTSIEDIAEIIRHDQAIASRVIAVANSAFLGYSGKIGGIDQAVMLLGFDLVRSISLAASIFNVFASQYGNLKQIWAHSYLVANIATSLCRKTAPGQKDSCFLAGLLHDIGRLALFRVIADSSQDIQIHKIARLKDAELLRAEEEIAGCNHTEAATWFLENLCFPEEIIAPVRTHHMPAGEGPLAEISATVYLAEGLSDVICPHIMHDGQWTEEHKRVFSAAGLQENSIDEISSSVAGEESAITKFFDL